MAESKENTNAWLRLAESMEAESVQLQADIARCRENAEKGLPYLTDSYESLPLQEASEPLHDCIANQDCGLDILW